MRLPGEMISRVRSLILQGIEAAACEIEENDQIARLATGPLESRYVDLVLLSEPRCPVAALGGVDAVQGLVAAEDSAHWLPSVR